jgi:hypothetical protein
MRVVVDGYYLQINVHEASLGLYLLHTYLFLTEWALSEEGGGSELTPTC